MQDSVAVRLLHVLAKLFTISSIEFLVAAREVELVVVQVRGENSL